MELDQHGGNLRYYHEILAKERLSSGDAKPEIIDFSANINPIGYADWVKPLINGSIDNLVHYPDEQYHKLRAIIAAHHGVSPGHITLCNGTAQILYWLPQILKVGHAVIPYPTFSEYEKACQRGNLKIIPLALDSAEGFTLPLTALQKELDKIGQTDCVVFIGRPNNPVGPLTAAARLAEFMARFPRVYFVIDEAFIDFVAEKGASMVSTCFAPNSADKWPRVIILRSLTKIMALPGLRIGYNICAPDLAERIRHYLPPWSLNSLAATLAERFFTDTPFIAKTKSQLKVWRDELLAGLQGIDGLRIYPALANFITACCQRLPAEKLFHRLLREFGIAIRPLHNMRGLKEGFWRVAVRTEEENTQLLLALTKILGGKAPRIKPQKKPAIMFVGTASNVGKSLLTAGMCRILYQEGYSVAPFKAQNMALNSYVTGDGREIGRAQAVQARASKVDVDVRMNPVLLKPSSTTGSQVIVEGLPLDHMDFRTYSLSKKEIFQAIKRNYESLAKDHDVVVLEGAGSISEVNLKDNDVVNMRMARLAQSATYLVGNIDTGGVFGSFLGTLATLSGWEARLLKGLIINKFRGIKKLLEPGLEYLQRYSSLRVMGVIPYISDLAIPDEDSVTFKASSLKDGDTASAKVEVALLDMPYISNFTDIDPFRGEPDVVVKIIREPEQFEAPDLVIIPGSKNVIHDYLFLRDRGFLRKLKQYYSQDKGMIVGICGGLQMLGRIIEDPYGVESKVTEMEGLDLLPLRSQFNRAKTLKRTQGFCNRYDAQVSGYEIHHGQSEPVAAISVFLQTMDGKDLGWSNDRGTVWGSYLHGIFDSDLFRRNLIDALRKSRGLKPLGRVIAPYSIEASLDRLADEMRKALDISAIFRGIGIR